MPRRVSATWTGGLSAVTDIRGVRWSIGDDARTDDGTEAPLPTETLLAAVASCFAMALAFVAGKRDLQLPNLRVDASGEFEGHRISRIEIAASADADPELIRRLLPSAERVCYITNTLRRPPEITTRCQSPG